MHWHDPQNMPWLRAQSVRTFRKYNPTWDLRVIGTPADIAEKGLEYAQEADWTWWRMLHDHGGFLVASDVISLRPIPDEWRYADLCVQTRGGNVFQFAALGAAKDNGLMQCAEEACEGLAPIVASKNRNVYQALGVNLLSNLTCDHIEQFGSIYEMPESAFCFYDWAADVNSMWTVEGPTKYLPDDAIGVHWYGGHDESRIRESTAREGGPSWLERLASDS